MNALPKPNPSRLDAVLAHLSKNPIARPPEADSRPTITKFGTVLVSQKGVEVRDFSTQHTPHEGDLPRLVIDWAIEQLLAVRGLFVTPLSGLERYTEAISHSLRSQNWFGALFLALAIPDICGALEVPDEQVGVRYRRWFEKYVGREYVSELFSASDCYYLRCAALHQGLAEHVKAQNKQVVFITPPADGSVFHSNFIESDDGAFVLQLQIDVFCRHICAGVTQWCADMQGHSEIQTRIGELLEFQDPTKPFKSKA